MDDKTYLEPGTPSTALTVHPEAAAVMWFFPNTFDFDLDAQPETKELFYKDGLEIETKLI